MADLSTAAENAVNALAASAEGGFVESYKIGNREVVRGNPADQVDAALKLQAVAARRAGGGPFRLSKFREER